MRKSSFRCILSDPPWTFRDQGSRIAPARAGHYSVMSLSSIIGLGDLVRWLAAPNSHLWMCCPNALVLDGTGALVMRLWGFVPKQLATGRKNRIGMGHWMRNSTEQVLFGVRGRLRPKARNVRTDFEFPVTRHSEKPDQLYRLIEAVSPGPRLEMFARRAVDGWRTIGNEAPRQTRLRLR